MANELIRLDTTIIGIDSLINKASTAEIAKVLFTVKDVIYSQQRYCTDVRPVRHGRWLLKDDGDIYEYSECSECENIESCETPYCAQCGAKMDLKGGDTE